MSGGGGDWYLKRAGGANAVLGEAGPRNRGIFFPRFFKFHGVTPAAVPLGDEDHLDESAPKFSSSSE